LFQINKPLFHENVIDSNPNRGGIAAYDATLQ